MPHYHERRRSSSGDSEPKQGVASGSVPSRLQSVDETEQSKTYDVVDAVETVPLIELQGKGQSTESQSNGLRNSRSEKGEVCPFLVSPLLCFCLFVCLFVVVVFCI